MRRLILVFGFVLAATFAFGATDAPPPNETRLVVPAGAEAGPGFDVERAAQAWIATLSPEQRVRSDAYFEGGYWLQLWSFLYGLGVAWVFLSLRLSARIRDRVARVSARPTLQALLYALVYIPLSSLLTFPLSWYSGLWREQKYGMATQTFGPWFGEQLIGLGVGMVLGGGFITLLYVVFRRAGRRWWVPATGVSVVFLVFAMAVSPLYIDPLFNSYKPLPPGPLRDRILSIAHASGVPASEVSWFDASRQTRRISANVAGFGATTRIALNDNLLSRTPPEGIAGVMGHELGHYVLNHVYEGILEFGILILVGFAFVAWGFELAVARWGARWGVTGIADPAGLPLFVVLFGLYAFVATPLFNTVIRVNEMEADRFGLAASNEPDGFAFVAMQLSEYRKISPGRWEEFVFYDHPSGSSRVRAAMQWKAEHGGKASAR